MPRGKLSAGANVFLNTAMLHGNTVQIKSASITRSEHRLPGISSVGLLGTS